MDNDEDDVGRRNVQNVWMVPYLFKTFVCACLTVLVGLHVYSYMSGTTDALDRGGDIKYIVTQLSQGLTEVNRKHEDLKTQIERLISNLPAITAATSRAKAALSSSCYRGSASHGSVDVHEYDRQIVDYALESAGGRILDTGDTIEHVVIESPVGYALYALTVLACRGEHCLSARAMINPGSLPGECWAFKGSRGQATIRLLGTVFISGVSLEHLPVHIAPTKEISSAPRLFQIEGLVSRSDPYPHDFGTFEYDQKGKPIQYYEVKHPTTKGYHIVRLHVLSNWGNPEFTCVYRLRIHGDLVPGQSPRPSEEEVLSVETE